MRSLFWKIFLSFWLLVTGLAVVILVTNSNRKNDRFDRFRQQQVALIANSSDYAVAEYEHNGVNGLGQALGKINTRIHGELWIVDENRQPLQGGTLPPEITAAMTMADDVTSLETYMLVRVPFEHEGKKYQALAKLNMPRPPRTPPGTELTLQILLAIVISSGICFVLARYIARPVTSLRVAAQRIAQGDLQARAHPSFEGNDELGALTRDFNRMAARLEATLVAQQRMFADVSHELRSPMSRMTLALELAKQRSGAQAASALERIEIEIGRMNTLVEQLLKLAKLETGVVEERFEVISMTEMLSDVASDAEIEANAKSCAVVLKNDIRALVEGEPDVLRSAIENVVRNAIQYSPEKSRIELVQRRDGPGKVVIEVADCGPGVSNEELEKMFEPFYRADVSRTRRISGVGLGLAIAERAVAAHHGSIRAANREKSGLIVEIKLPMYGIET